MCQVLRSGVKNDEIWATDNTGLKTNTKDFILETSLGAEWVGVGKGFRD